MAHAALLEKFDAFASMPDKAKGDTADILQNVYCQKALFARVGLPRDMVTQVTERSANFIHAFERNKAGVTISPSWWRPCFPPRRRRPRSYRGRR
jgi:hypothetical protein